LNSTKRWGFFGVTAMISCVLSFACAAARPIGAQSLPETVEAIGRAEQRRNRWTAVALWAIAALLAVVAWLNSWT